MPPWRAGIDAPRRDEEGTPVSANSPLLTATGMARAAVALADDGPQAGWPPLADSPRPRQRSPRSSASRKSSNGRAARDEGLLEGGEGFADADKDFFVRDRVGPNTA